MNLHADKNRAAENCPEYESSMPLITNLSSMALSCASCLKYQSGTCSMALADRINDITSMN